MNYQGKDSLIWFTGIVEDRNDPKFLNRVRVRIYGAHTHDKQLIATPDLPWSEVMMPTTSPSLSGLGTTLHGLVEGSTVMGFYRDGTKQQDPVIIGSFVGTPQTFYRIDNTIDDQGKRNFQVIHRTTADGFNDPRLATAEDYEIPQGLSEGEKLLHKPGDTSSPDGKNPQHINRNYGLTLALDKSPRRSGETTGEIYPKTGYLATSDVNVLARNYDDTTYPIIEIAEGEPKRDYVGPVYPFNHVHETESGHVLELDDTPDKERIHLYHRKGTRVEIDKDGNYVEKIVKDKYSVILGNDNITVEGIADIKIGDSSLSSVMGALGGIAGVTDIVGTDLLDKISPDILAKLPDGLGSITEQVQNALDGQLNPGSMNFADMAIDVAGFAGGNSGTVAIVDRVKNEMGTSLTDEASTKITEVLSSAFVLGGRVDSTISEAEKEITNLLGDKLGSETSSALNSVINSSADSVDIAVNAVTSKVKSALTDTLGAEVATEVADQVTDALNGALSGAVGGVLGAGGAVVTINIGGNANVMVTGTTTLTSTVATNITAPLINLGPTAINSTGVWNHVGAMTVTGILTATGIWSQTYIKALYFAGVIADHVHKIFSGSSAPGPTDRPTRLFRDK